MKVSLDNHVTFGYEYMKMISFTDILGKIFTDAGFEVVTNEYVMRETVNKKEGLCVPRVFVQGKFKKKR